MSWHQWILQTECASPLTSHSLYKNSVIVLCNTVSAKSVAVRMDPRGLFIMLYDAYSRCQFLPGTSHFVKT